MRRILLALFLFAFAATAQTPRGYYRQPAIHGDVILFVAEGDLWRVPVAGGIAQRLTSHPGQETFPAISPDGTTLAFAAEYEGPTEIYTMPLNGGVPTRHTFDGAEGRVVGWTPDGQVLYRTTKFSTLPNSQLVRLDPKTGARRVLPLAQASEGVFAPDGKTLFFTRLPKQSSSTKRYEGGWIENLWRFTEGEPEAVPLARDFPGTSRNPMWWQDRVCFISDRDGTMNLWSMKPDGTDLKQLTKHTGFDLATASLHQGRIAYSRAGDLHVFDLASGRDTQLNVTLASDFDQQREKWIKKPLDYLTSAHLSPNGDRLALTARGQVFVAPLEAGRFVEVPRKADVRYREASFLPDGKNLLVQSDESGELEFWKLPANGLTAPTALTTNGSVFRYAGKPSPDGKRLAWGDKDWKLWIHDFETGLTTPVAEGRTDDLTDFAWSPDSRWLAYVQAAANGYPQIHLFNATDGTHATVTSDRVDSFSPAWSPDGKWLYFLSDRELRSLVGSPWGQRQPEPHFTETTKIYAIALKKELRSPFLPKDEGNSEDAKDTKEEKRDATEPGSRRREEAEVPHRDLEVPNSKFGLARPHPGPLPRGEGESAPAIAESPVTANAHRQTTPEGIEAKQSLPNRATAEGANHPVSVFRNAGPAASPSPGGEGRGEGGRSLTSPSSFVGADTNSLKATASTSARSASTDAKTNKPPAVIVNIDLDGLATRLFEVPVTAGNYSNLEVTAKHLLWVARDTGFNAKNHLRQLEITAKVPKAKSLVEDLTSYELAGDGKKLLVRKGDNFYVIASDAGAPAKLDDKFNLDGWTFALTPREEWRQILTESWRMLRDYFYDRGMHSLDWRGVLQKYLPLVDRVSERNELNEIIAEMVGELSTLHIYVRYGDDRDGPDQIKPASLGARFARDEAAGGWRVEHLFETDPEYPDELSPLRRPGVDVRPGDVLTAVNGRPTLSVPQLDQLLRNQAGKPVLLTVKSAGTNTLRQVTVKPVSTDADAELRYDEWEFTRRRRVEELGTNQIGYVHLRAMGSENMAEWAREYYPVFNRQGLIIDVRHNRGGNIDSWILNRLLRKAWFFWQPRVGDPTWNMQQAFRGHVVVLCNERTASDGEAFAEGFRRLGLGKVIGTRTWGGEIWLSSRRWLVDSGMATAAEIGVYGPEGAWLIEGHGVDPDVVVDNLPHSTFNGRDAQLEAAVKHLQELIAKDPRPVPPAPKYPDKRFPK
jgi:tricorn protease-like protein/C-terminal processing protease CtpA/Prc